MRRERDRREERLLIVLREAQLTVPQTVHINSTKLPKMTEGEDIQTFVELFEAAMTDNETGKERFMPP